MSNDDRNGPGYSLDSDFASAPESEGGVDSVAAPQGFLERLGNSFGSILFGLALIPLACWGLFWNEGRAVKTARALTEGQGIVQTVGTQRVDPAMNGKLVHVSGDARSATGVGDEDFGVRVRGLRLERTVEMYQWVEKETGSGQDRKFTYTREWSGRAIDSSRFKAPEGHRNPGSMPYRNQSFSAGDARIGAFPLGGAVRNLGASTEHRLDASVINAARQRGVQRAQLTDGALYIGNDPGRPIVGDVKVAYRIAPEGPASFVGRQGSNGLENYRASNGNEFLLAQSGTKTPDEMFKSAQDDNATMTWILRVVGLVVLFIGFVSLFAPVNLLASYIPILGSLVSGAVSLVAAAATALVGPVVIAIAWLAYRPVVSVVVFGIGVALALLFRQMRLRKQRGATMPGGAAPAS
jgi:hypothetical protein